MNQKYLPYAFLSLLFTLFLTLPSACIDDPEVEPGIQNAHTPQMGETVTINALTASSVTLTATVVQANGAAITERGFCWSEQAHPTVDHHTKVFGKGIGEYQGTVDGLVNGRDYYIRPYARNAKGVAYGEERKVQTQTGLGLVHTFIIADSTRAATAVCGGRIEISGEGEILARGVYYSTSPDMNPKDSVLSTFTADSFLCPIRGLRPSTTYYVEAFVRNHFGVYNGTRKSFTTTDGRSVVSSLTVLHVSYTSASVSATVLSAGDAPIEERGFCWSTLPDPTLTNSPHVEVGSGTGPFTGQCTGLEANRKYYVRAYAGNRVYGYSYSAPDSFTTLSSLPTVVTLPASTLTRGTATLGGRIVSPGQSTVTSCGICWSLTDETPTLYNAESAELTLSPGGTFTGQLSGLKGGRTYYIRAYATNAEGTSYGETVVQRMPSIFRTIPHNFPGAARLQGTPTCFTTTDRGYLLGGDIGPYYSADLYYYSTTTNEWRQMLACPAGPLKWQTAITLGGSAYVFGGIDVNHRTRNSFYRYDIASNTWYTIASSPAPDSLCLALGVALNGNIFLIGGRGDTATNHVWGYNVAASTWIRQPDFPTQHYGGVALTVGTMVYAGLGRNADGSFNRNLWRTIDLSTWTPETVCSVANGGILAGTTCRNKLYLIDESFTILEYDPATHTWTRRAQLPSDFRGIHCMFTLNDIIYIGLSQQSSTLLAYDPTWDN